MHASLPLIHHTKMHQTTGTEKEPFFNVSGLTTISEQHLLPMQTTTISVARYSRQIRSFQWTRDDGQIICKFLPITCRQQNGRTNATKWSQDRGLPSSKTTTCFSKYTICKLLSCVVFFPFSVLRKGNLWAQMLCPLSHSRTRQKSHVFYNWSTGPSSSRSFLRYPSHNKVRSFLHEYGDTYRSMAIRYRL